MTAWGIVRKYWQPITILILVLLLLTSVRSCQSKSDSATTLMGALHVSDSIVDRTRDNLNRETIRKEVAVATNVKLFTQIESADEQISNLQRLLSQKGNITGATTVSTSTSVESTAPTQTDTVEANVVYMSSYSDDWISWHGIADREEFTVNFAVRNDFEYSQKVVNPLFKRKRVEAIWKNLNPYTETKEFASVVIQPRPKKWGLGPQVGYGFSDNGTGVYLGFGAHYNLLHIK